MDTHENSKFRQAFFDSISEAEQNNELNATVYSYQNRHLTKGK